MRQHIKATCHPDKKHYCKGLCSTCYNKKYKTPKMQLRRANAKYVEDYKRPGYVETVMNNWQNALDDPGVIVNILRGVFSGHKPDEIVSV